MTCQLASAIANWKTDFARSTPTMGSAAVAFISDSPRLSADTPHHMRPAGTMMPRSRGESIPSLNRTARDPMKPFFVRSRAVPALATGAQAHVAVPPGTVALGALAIGALAIGALAINRLVVGRARIRRLEIDELVVRRLRVTEEYTTPPPPPRGPEGAIGAG